MSTPIEFPKLPTRVDTPIRCQGCTDPWYVEPCPVPSVFFPIRACCPSCKREILFPDFETAAENLGILVFDKPLPSGMSSMDKLKFIVAKDNGYEYDESISPWVVDLF